MFYLILAAFRHFLQPASSIDYATGTNDSITAPTSSGIATGKYQKAFQRATILFLFLAFQLPNMRITETVWLGAITLTCAAQTKDINAATRFHQCLDPKPSAVNEDFSFRCIDLEILT